MAAPKWNENHARVQQIKKKTKIEFLSAVIQSLYSTWLKNCDRLNSVVWLPAFQFNFEVKKNIRINWKFSGPQTRTWINLNRFPVSFIQRFVSYSSYSWFTSHIALHWLRLMDYMNEETSTNQVLKVDSSVDWWRYSCIWMKIEDIIRFKPRFRSASAWIFYSNRIGLDIDRFSSIRM